jgi:hypothetical protein
MLAEAFEFAEDGNYSDALRLYDLTIIMTWQTFQRKWPKNY